MNLNHFKYALEISRTGSINQAAENLFMSQPNLSKAMREFEAELGFAIFTRTSKGIRVTRKGDEFLIRARRILAEVEELESLYKAGAPGQSVSVCVPHAYYIARALSSFISHLEFSDPLEVIFREAGSRTAIESVASGESRLGIIRCPAGYESEFFRLLAASDIESRLLYEFEPRIIMACSHPLAAADPLTVEMLEEYPELVHTDTALPLFLPSKQSGKAPRRRVAIDDRDARVGFLTSGSNAYAWVSPLPGDYLAEKKIAMRACSDCPGNTRDILIHRKGHALSGLETLFLENLAKIIRELA